MLLIRNIVIILLILLKSTNSYSLSTIRDSEIEETIWLVAEPVVKASGLSNLRFHIIDDKLPNAFTIGGNDIFIHSGLIMQFPDPDILRGIIAHEIGHITGHHIERSSEMIDNYSKFALGGALLGLAAAMSSGDANAGLATALGGIHVADRSISAYSRSYESSADQTALHLLEKSGHSAIGLINFFSKSRIHLHSSEFANPYEQTHPMDNERLRIIKDFYAKSKFKESRTSSDILYRYVRSAAKLAAYSLNIAQKIQITSTSAAYQGEINLYIQTIKDFRSGKLKSAIESADKLLSIKPDDPYYHELKGQILFEYNSNLALAEYDKATKLRPNDKLLKLGKAIVGITNNLKEPVKMEPFYQDLLSISKSDHDNLLILFYLAIYYEKHGLIGKSYLNSAIIASKTGNAGNAIRMAKAAMQKLPVNSPDWYKASDLVDTITNMKK